MKPIGHMWVGLGLLVCGCQSMPTVTRTGEVKDIVIGEKLSSGELPVSPVQVVLLDPVTDKQLSCKHNFGGWRTRSDTAALDTNETASACFRDPGYVRYTVRMQSALPSGEINVPGVVTGGASGQPAASSSTRTTTTITTTTEPR